MYGILNSGKHIRNIDKFEGKEIPFTDILQNKIICTLHIC